MELFNEISAYSKDSKRFNPDFYNEVVETFIIMLSPFTPHIAEELWELIGNKPSLHNVEWPKFDENALVKQIQTITVQVNGKVKANIEAPIDIDDEKIKTIVYDNDKIKGQMEGKNLIKTIVINAKSGKMVNLVLK